MGLQTWKNAPEGRILKSDTKIAKNYLSEKEIKSLERTITSFFDYIERIIEARNTFTMEQFAESVNKFLEFNEYKVLTSKGKINLGKKKVKGDTIDDECSCYTCKNFSLDYLNYLFFQMHLLFDLQFQKKVHK